MLVRPMVPTVTIELRNLEETTTEEEIRKAFIAALVEATSDQVEVKALCAGPRGAKATLVVAPRALATAKVLKPGKVRVGWVNATAHKKKLVIRCFKCLEFGHVAVECSKNILQKLCYRCGEPGHLAAGCGKPYKCLACEATGKFHGHRTGDVTCAALQIARGKLEHRQNGNG